MKAEAPPAAAPNTTNATLAQPKPKEEKKEEKPKEEHKDDKPKQEEKKE